MGESLDYSSTSVYHCDGATGRVFKEHLILFLTPKFWEPLPGDVFFRCWDR